MTVAAPPDWPIKAPGFYLGYIDNLLLTLMGEQCTAASLARYLTCMDQGVAAMRDSDRIISVHVIGAPSFWTAATMAERVRHLRQLSALGDRHKHRLAHCFRFEVIVPTSSLARITLRTLMTLTKMPYPSAVEPSPEAAFARLKRMEDADVQSWRDRAYAITRQVAPDLWPNEPALHAG